MGVTALPRLTGRQTENRATSRMVVQVPADVQQSDGARAAMVADISPHGCRVVDSAGPVTMGAPVTVRPAGLDALTAWVRWADEGEIGLEFARPLGKAALEYLVRRHAVPVDFPDLPPDARKARAIPRPCAARR